MTARLPSPPPAAQLSAIGIRDDEYRIVGTDEVWWRVHRTTGEHVLGWNAFREHGPHLRFDPHPPPAQHHAGIGFWYGACGPTPALAEAFQAERTIDRFRGGPYLTGLRFTRAMPTRPVLSLPLTHPGLAVRIATAAQRLGYLAI